MNIAELQQVLDIGRDNAYNLVQDNDFPSVKLGKKYNEGAVVRRCVPRSSKPMRGVNSSLGGFDSYMLPPEDHRLGCYVQGFYFRWEWLIMAEPIRPRLSHMSAKAG